MYCRAIPYEGEEPYIFVSYCHADEKSVYPLIERLAGEGYRIWYDNGIHPGSDWMEVIAKHLTGSSLCIAIVTKEFADSHNCRNELTFAVNNKIQCIGVCEEGLQLALGMKMALASSQNIKQQDLSKTEELYRKLLGAEGIFRFKDNRCYLSSAIQENEEPKKERVLMLDRIPHVKADEDLCLLHDEKVKELQSEEEPSPTEDSKINTAETVEKDLQERIVQQEIVLEEISSTGKEDKKDGDDQNPAEAESLVQNIAGEEKETDSHKTEDGPDLEKTVYDEEPADSDEDKTILLDAEKGDFLFRIPALLVDLNESVFYKLSQKTTRIGRSAGNQIVLKGGAISSRQAEIAKTTKGYTIRDLGSSNGTFVNGTRLLPDTVRYLKSGDRVTFADEDFLFAWDFLSTKILTSRKYYKFTCEETQEDIILSQEEFLLGRENIWSSGAFSDKRASHKHGTIRYTDNGCILMVSRKPTANGTFLDGVRLDDGQEIRLPDVCEIRIGRVYHIRFETISVEEET